MPYASILASIKNTMESIPDIGRIHDYVRWNKDRPDFFSLFKISSPTSQIRAWDITRKKTPETANAARTNIRTHSFGIRGFMSHDDATATEKTFQNLIEDVAAAFRNKPAFGEAVLNVEPLQVNNVDHAMIGDVLCHLVECTLEIQEEVQWTE